MSGKDDPASQLSVNLGSPTVVRDNFCFNDAVTGPKLIVSTLDAYANPAAGLFSLDNIAMRAAANGR
jgi:hypothetical protein